MADENNMTQDRVTTIINTINTYLQSKSTFNTKIIAFQTEFVEEQNLKNLLTNFDADAFSALQAAINSFIESDANTIDTMLTQLTELFTNLRTIIIENDGLLAQNTQVRDYFNQIQTDYDISSKINSITSKISEIDTLLAINGRVGQNSNTIAYNFAQIPEVDDDNGDDEGGN